MSGASGTDEHAADEHAADGHVADGHRLAYEVVAGDGPVALFLGGRYTTRSYWRRNIEVLLAHCSPVLVELWGHGASPSPVDPARYRPDAYVAEFERIRRDVGAERVVVVGQSMGGSLFMHYALTHPQRVAGLVFTNALSAFSPVEGWDRRSAAAAAEADRLLGPGGRDVLDADSLNPGRSTRLEPTLRAALAAEWAQHDLTGLARGYRHTIPVLPVRERFAELGPLGVPVLLTHGVRETAFAPQAAWAKELLPSMEVVELDAGHATNLHAADGFNAAVIAFLARMVAAGA